MKAQELRVGNYVQLEDKFIEIDIESFSNKNIMDLPLTEWCQPILLTEDWLLKFGFYIVNPSFSNKIYYNKIRPELEIRLSGNEYNLGIESEWLKEIKYVHELQNLYFVLTGEELNKKE